MTTNTKDCNETVVHTQTCCTNNSLIILVVFILLAIILGSYFVF